MNFCSLRDLFFRFTFIIELFVFFGFLTSCDNEHISQRELNRQFKNDSLKLVEYIEKGDPLKSSELDSSLAWMDRGLEYLNEREELYGGRSSYDLLIADFLHIKGVALKFLGHFEEAIHLMNESIDTYHSNSKYGLLGICYNNLASVYEDIGDIENATKYYLKSVSYREQAKDTVGMGYSLSNLGLLNRRQGLLEDAKQYYTISLGLFQSVDDSAGMAMVYNNIGVLFNNIEKHDSALHYYYKAYRIREYQKLSSSLINSLSNIGIVLAKQNKLDSARVIFERELKLAEKMQYKKGIIVALTDMGYICFKESEFEEALNFTLRADSMASENAFHFLRKETARLLRKIHLAQNDYESAYYVYLDEVQVRDSIQNVENKTEVIKQRFQFEQAKKDAVATEQLRRKEFQRNAFIGGFILTLFVAVVIFRQRIRVLKEKKKSEELLLNILPAETAEELKNKGSSDARLIDEVTVLFTDFKGFTELARNLPPSVVVEMINECFSAFDYIMQKHQVEKIKTIGDAYMAAGGLPKPNTTHAFDVINAAKDVQKFMLDFKERREMAGLPAFEIRIGVHTGPVVAGIVGVKKFQYDIWGDTVNTASRMESNAEVGKINISQSTYDIVKTKFACKFRGEIEVKGKGLMKMYFVD